MDVVWFRNRMKEVGATQEDVGAAIGRDRSAASRLLSGALEFKAAHAGPLALVLKTNPSEILMRAGVELNLGATGRPPAPHSRVEAAIEAFAAGEIIVVTDDDDRENEGDLIVAASLCTPEKMAFIVRHTSGIVCAPLTREIAQKLRLDPMVANNDAPLSTAFTVSVDVRHG
ncbi:MAG: 3,4-dihydroxy-2-butanone-4-phosphate synthase, partial [Gemmataceae bacterium]